MYGYVQISCLRVRTLFFCVSCLLLPPSVYICNGPLRGAISLSAVLGGVYITCQSRLRCSGSFLPSFSFPTGRLLLCVCLGNVMCRLLRRHGIGRRGLRVGVSVRADSIIFQIGDNFGSLKEGRGPISLTRVRRLSYRE